MPQMPSRQRPPPAQAVSSATGAVPHVPALHTAIEHESLGCGQSEAVAHGPHVPWEQTRGDAQSLLTVHVWPALQGGQVPPPQSTPVSLPSLTWSVQLGPTVPPPPAPLELCAPDALAEPPAPELCALDAPPVPPLPAPVLCALDAPPEPEPEPELCALDELVAPPVPPLPEPCPLDVLVVPPVPEACALDVCPAPPVPAPEPCVLDVCPAPPLPPAPPPGTAFPSPQLATRKTPGNAHATRRKTNAAIRDLGSRCKNGM